MRTHIPKALEPYLTYRRLEVLFAIAKKGEDQNLGERNKIPDYITLDKFVQIMRTIGKGLLNPTHNGCDTTLEISAGIPLEDALTTHSSPNKKPSTYGRWYSINLALPVYS